MLLGRKLFGMRNFRFTTGFEYLACHPSGGHILGYWIVPGLPVIRPKPARTIAAAPASDLLYNRPLP